MTVTTEYSEPVTTPDKIAETGTAPVENTAVSDSPNNKVFTWLFSAFVIVALIAIAWHWQADIRMFLNLISDQETVSAYLQGFGLLGPFVLALAQMMQVLIAFIPGHVFLIAAGYVYGFPLGLLLNITFTVAASQICYLLARWAGRPVVHKFVKPATVDQWERIANQKGVLFFTLAFLLPVFPSDAMNFVGGLSGISARKFLVANFLGRFPSAVMLTLIGSHGLEMTPTAWVAITAVTVFLFLIGRYAMAKIHAQAQTPANILSD
ncbi:MAG: TVP38/TMEM64 family protein [Anaerolineales bacterium]|nr:TVP38/TMEM64 family protein [Anaerolineales bacterium]